MSSFQEMLEDLKAHRQTTKELERALRLKRRDLREMQKHYARLVYRGVNEVLEKRVPGWQKKIHLPTLDLENADHCVLGQLAAKSALTSAGFDLEGGSDFWAATYVLDISSQEFGFDITNGHEDRTDDAYYVLNHLWTRAIRLRKAGKKVTINELTKVAL